MNKKIIVTGGAGFIGSWVVEILLEQGYHVIVIDNFSTGKRENLTPHARLQIVRDDLSEQGGWCPLIQQEGAAVIHLAAQVSAALSVEKPLFSMKHNIQAFLKLVEVCKAQSLPLIYASSAAIYGDKNQEAPLQEHMTTLHKPQSPYGLEKYILEQYAALYQHLYQLPSLGLRFFNVYGARQDPSSQYSGVISKFVHALQTDRQITIFGDGNQTRDFIYVKDVARIVTSALQQMLSGQYIGNDVANVATGHSITINELWKIMQKISGITYDVTYQPPRAGDIYISKANIEKVREQGLLQTDLTALEDGLQTILPIQVAL